jgi:CheY-like chemotaxis protein
VQRSAGVSPAGNERLSCNDAVFQQWMEEGPAAAGPCLDSRERRVFMTNLHAHWIRLAYSGGTSTASGRVASHGHSIGPVDGDTSCPARTPERGLNGATSLTMTLPHVAQPQATHWPPRSPARVLMVLDRPVLIELIRLTLNHGVYSTRAVTTATDAANVLSEWQPHLAMLDMDLDGAQILALLGAKHVGGMRLPVLGLTRRGDLKTKLAAFEAGVDDILSEGFDRKPSKAALWLRSLSPCWACAKSHTPAVNTITAIGRSHMQPAAFGPGPAIRLVGLAHKGTPAPGRCRMEAHLLRASRQGFSCGRCSH